MAELAYPGLSLYGVVVGLHASEYKVKVKAVRLSLQTATKREVKRTN